MSTFIALVVFCALAVLGSVVGVSLVLLVADRAERRREREKERLD